MASGIGVSTDLSNQFSAALDSESIRFIKVSIVNESLVYESSIEISGSLQDDLKILQSPEFIQDDIPAYILARLDDPKTEWLAIHYVPDTAKVRDKMLYASTRASLIKSLGSTHFTDSIFATSKTDLTPESYVLHRRHINAPKPLSAREQELADVRAAEKLTEQSYDGSRTRLTHLDHGPGFGWQDDATDAIRKLGESESARVVVLSVKINSSTEELALHSASNISADELGSALPTSEPSYAFFAYPHNSPQQNIVFIYSCPSTCPVKNRMIYASGATSVYLAATQLLAPYQSLSIHPRRIETSDPKEINDAFLREELGLDRANGSMSTGGTSAPIDEKKPFAKPRGPARRK